MAVLTRVEIEAHEERRYTTWKSSARGIWNWKRLVLGRFCTVRFFELRPGAFA